MRGFWIGDPWDRGLWVEGPELMPYSAPVIPPVWIPPEPLFPESVGELLHAILHPEMQPCPPYTHTFNLPATEYDDDGEPLPMPIEPTMTVTRLFPDTTSRPLRTRLDLHPLLLDHDIDRGLTWTD